MRSLTRESAAEEQVALRDEVVEIESRPTERRLTDRELEAGGLFKERAIEIAEMREEPVVTKVAVVHEEVIVRKTVKERTETIRDTVRHTEVEVEDLPAPEGSALPSSAVEPKGTLQAANCVCEGADAAAQWEHARRLRLRGLNQQQVADGVSSELLSASVPD